MDVCLLVAMNVTDTQATIFVLIEVSIYAYPIVVGQLVILDNLIIEQLSVIDL